MIYKCGYYQSRICKCYTPKPYHLIHKHIQMRLLEITALINNIYKCGYIAVFDLRMPADQMRLYSRHCKCKIAALV